MQRFLRIAISMALLLATAATYGNTTIFNDDFSSRSLPPGSSLFNGNVSFPGDFMNLSYGCLILPGSYNRNDGLAIDVDANITWGGAGDFNLFAFYDPFDDNIAHCVSAGVVHGYNFGVFPAGSDNPEDFLQSSIDGTSVELHRVPATMPAGQYFHVRAEIHRDGLVRVLLNGHETMRMTNFDHFQGKLVLRTWGDVYIDNLNISTLGERPPCPDCDWASLKRLITPRVLGAAGIASVNGKVTVVGHHEGNPGSGRINEEYDPVADHWTSKTPYPRGDGRLALNSDAVIGNDIYFFGGANIFNNYHTRNVDKYNPVTDTWLLDVASYPLTVGNLATTSFGGSIYCFGGSDYNGPPYDAAFRFDGSVFTPLATMPHPREHARAFVHDNHIWVAGGYAYPSAFFDSMDIYDPATDTWAPGPLLPFKAYLYWAGFLSDGALYAVYEENGTPAIYRRNGSTGVWSLLCLAPRQTTNFGVYGDGSAIHIIGGATPGTNAFTTIHVAAMPASADALPPAITAPPDVTVNAGPSCNAFVSDAELGTATAADECGDVSITRTGVPPGNIFPLGTTTITYTAVDAGGNGATATQTVTTVDNTPPAITNVSATPNVLWSPNHKMVDVLIRYDAAENCGGTVASLSVKSNEPVDGLGDGDTAPDWQIVDSHHVRLRAERAGMGSGRIYTITVTVKDDHGNASSADVVVRVPHNE